MSQFRTRLKILNSSLHHQGFLNVTARDGGFFFGSAVKGAQRDAKLEQSVMNQPYNISILGLSHAIVTPGLDGTLVPVTAPPPKTTAAPPPSKTSSPPAESPEEEVVEAEAPATKAPAPSKEADSPVSSPPVSADAPADDEADDKAPASSKSSAGKMNVSLGLFVVLVSMVAAY